MKDEKNDNFVEKLKKMIDSAIIPDVLSDYPPNAVPLGTFARCIRNNRLGLVMDAFYGDVDEVGEKIIVYTVLLLPKSSPYASKSLKNDKYYLINEYEYDIIAYLMIKPVDIKEISKNFVGDFL
jgi:hypothetical protein